MPKSLSVRGDNDPVGQALQVGITRWVNMAPALPGGPGSMMTRTLSASKGHAGGGAPSRCPAPCTPRAAWPAGSCSPS